MRAGIVKNKAQFIIFLCRRGNERVVAGYYRLAWKTEGIWHTTKLGYALAADSVHFVDPPIPVIHGPCRPGRRGKREFVQVLRLVETFSQQGVAAALKDALRLGAISFDAVKHLVLCRLEGRPPRLDLELYPYLPRVGVSTTSAGDYMTLLSGRAA